MKERDPQIALDPEVYEWVKREAKRNKRTIKGQVEAVLEQAKERHESIEAGKTQLNPEVLQKS